MVRHPDPRAARGWPFALAGAVAAAVMLGAAELASAVFSPLSSSLVAVGDAFIDVTPAWLKDFAVSTFGTADKAVLLVCMVVVSLGVASALGLVARRRLGLAVVLGVGIAVLLGAAVLSRPGTRWFDVLPTAVGAVAGFLVLQWLVRKAHRVGAVTDSGVVGGRGTHPTDVADVLGGIDRRAFLLVATVTTAAAVLAAVGGRALSATSRTTAAARAALRLPRPRRPAAPLPAGVGADVPGMPPFVTPNAEFYRIDTAIAVPQVDPADWRLRVHGMVEQELSLGFSELLGLDLQESWVTLACVSNPVGGDLVGNALWLGYPVRDLLARARPLRGADMVLSTSVDGFSASTPLEAMTDGRDALLAVGMNGEPLPLEHGFPVRLVVPGLYGYVSATKWVVDLEVTRFADAVAYWTPRGWSERGPVKLASRIDVPRDSSTVTAAGAVLGGTAWAQGTGIDRVQVQVDEGAWRDATLAAEATVDTWRQWSLDWAGAPGEHTARVRAVDGAGHVQTSERVSPAPDGATGWHEIRFRAR